MHVQEFSSIGAFIGHCSEYRYSQTQRCSAVTIVLSLSAARLASANVIPDSSYYYQLNCWPKRPARIAVDRSCTARGMSLFRSNGRCVCYACNESSTAEIRHQNSDAEIAASAQLQQINQSESATSGGRRCYHHSGEAERELIASRSCCRFGWLRMKLCRYNAGSGMQLRGQLRRCSLCGGRAVMHSGAQR